MHMRAGIHGHKLNWIYNNGMNVYKFHNAVALMEAKEDFYAYKSGVYRSALSDDMLTPARQQNKKRLHSVKILG